MTTEAESKKVDEGGADGAEEEKPVPEPLRHYLRPGPAYVIIEKEWVRFVLMTAVIYLIHLVWMCYGVDVYSSYERHVPCKGKSTNEGASALYDTWILLCVVFHMLEWIRQTIFVTSALVGVNLIQVFYGMYIIIPYGIIVQFGGGLAAAFSEPDCKEKQPNRSMFLLLQFVGLVGTLITAGMHLIVFWAKGNEWCCEVTNREDEEDDD